MKSSLFRAKIPRELLLAFLRDVGRKERNGFVIYDELLKRKGREASIAAFLCAAMTYYYPSKWHYVRKAFDAKTLMTVIRQICKSHGIPVSSKTLYQHSKYTIHYKIIVQEPSENTPQTEPDSE